MKGNEKIGEKETDTKEVNERKWEIEKYEKKRNRKEVANENEKTGRKWEIDREI